MGGACFRSWIYDCRFANPCVIEKFARRSTFSGWVPSGQDMIVELAGLASDAKKESTGV